MKGSRPELAHRLGAGTCTSQDRGSRGETCPVNGQPLPARSASHMGGTLSTAQHFCIARNFLIIRGLRVFRLAPRSWRLACIVLRGNRLGRYHNAGNSHLECFAGQCAGTRGIGHRPLGRAAAFFVRRIVSGNCKDTRSELKFSSGGQAAGFGSTAG